MLFNSQNIQSYGLWKSEISTEVIVKESVKFIFLEIDEENIYFTESRPFEMGRNSLVKHNFKNESFEDLAENFNIRTKVHEYGGKSFFTYSPKKEIFFINFNDQAIYKINENKEIEKVFSQNSCRYADIILDETKNVLYAIEEFHQNEKVLNSIVKIDIASKEKELLAKGNDFYSSLSLNSDKSKLSFITWNHPNMSWDSSFLYVLDLNENTEEKKMQLIAGGENESISQPKFIDEDRLLFLSDRNNFYNIYLYDDKTKKIEIVCDFDADFAYPDWVTGFSNYVYDKQEKESFIWAICDKNASSKLLKINLDTKSFEILDLPFTHLSNLQGNKNNLVFLAGSPEKEMSIYLFDKKTEKCKLIKTPREIDISKKFISKGSPIEFINSSNEKVFGFYYPPYNENYKGKENEKPPLIVKAHGGPTGNSYQVLDLSIQFFTSRGFGVLDINYSGSSGYGRKYRNRIYGKWGKLDPLDCIDGAKYLVSKGFVDKDKLIIKGGSAGGFTTLTALTFFDEFNIGCSYYGVSDLKSLMNETHKFESHYLEKLIGPYEQNKEKYFDLSPINNLEKIKNPIIFFQGAEDKIVLENQSSMMFQGLKKRKIKTAYILFPNEGHGFKNAAHIEKALQAELFFYRKILKLPVDYNLPFLEIKNLKEK